MRSFKKFIHLMLIFGFSSFAVAQNPSEVFSGCSEFRNNGNLNRYFESNETQLEVCLQGYPENRADSKSCKAIACAAYFNSGTLQSWTDSLRAMQPPKAADFEKKRDLKKAKQAFALDALNFYYVQMLGRHDQLEKGVFGSICARDFDGFSKDYEFDCNSRKFSYENAENIRNDLLEAIEPRLSSLRRTAAIEDKYGNRSPFWSLFYQQWWSDENEFNQWWINSCEFPELDRQAECDKRITFAPVPQKPVFQTEWRNLSSSWLLAAGAEIDNKYSGSKAEQIFELGSTEYEVKLANTIDFYDKQLGGILDQLIRFAEWEDTDARARFLRSTYSEKRREWLCESIFDETAETQRALVRTSTTSDLDFCDATALWGDLANSVALEPGLLKDFKFSERWIPATYLRYETDSYETASLNKRYDFALKHGSEWNLKRLVRSLLSHISLSVLFTSQSDAYRYDYSVWREKLEKLANDFYFKDISREADIEKRVQLATYSEEYYEFLAFLANANTQREKSIFAVYEKLTSSKGLAQAAEYRQTLEQYGEKSLDYVKLGFCKARQGDSLRFVTDPLFSSLAEDFAVYRATVAISEEDKDKIDSNASTRVALFWPEDDSGMGRECDRVIESIRELN